MRPVIKHYRLIKAARRRGQDSVFIRAHGEADGVLGSLQLFGSSRRAHGRFSNYVIDSSNRPSDPARIKSTSDKESQREKRDSSFLTVRSVYGVSVRIQSCGQLAKYLFARSTFEINSRGCLSVSNVSLKNTDIKNCTLPTNVSAVNN